MKRAMRSALLPVGLATLAAGMGYGGWAVTTVDDFPDSAVAGRPLTLSWVVRQHGRQPLDDLRGAVEAVSGGSRVEAAASKVAGAGRYQATLTLPSAGEWRIAIRHGFLNERRQLPPLTVVAEGSPAGPSLSDVERGERMFVTKGCITCHQEIAVGPSLAGRRYDEAWLVNWLTSPTRTASLPRDRDPMPNLGLQPREVAALAAYVNGGRLSAR